MMQANAVTHHKQLKQGHDRYRWCSPWLLGNFGAVVLSAATVLTAVSGANAEPIENWQFDTQSNQLSFVLPDGVKPRYFIMAQPARIVVDVPNAQVGELPLEQEYSGSVKRISVSQLQPQLMRVILEMAPTASFARGQVKLENVGDAAPGKDRWVVTPLLKGMVSDNRPAADAPPQPIAAPPKPTAAAPISQPEAAKPIETTKPPELKPPELAKAPEAAALPALPSEPIKPPATPTVSAAPPSLVVKSPLPKTKIPKPEPKPAEIPPGLDSVVNTPFGGTTAMGSSPVPSLPTTPATIARSTPPPVSQREPERVPIMQLPPAPPNPAAPLPGGPAASVMPTPVTRPDLTRSSSAIVTPPLPPVQPMVSVPPLSTIGSAPIMSAPPVAPPQPAAPAIPGLPPLPPLPSNPAPTVAPPALPVATALPPVTPVSAPLSNGSETGGLPDLPPVSPRGVSSPQSSQISQVPFSAVPVPTAPTATPIAPLGMTAPTLRPSSGVIDFGQPLPFGGSTNIATGGIQALDNITTGGITVPAGNVLTLRYDRLNTLKLKAGERQQEILVLQTPIFDSTGRVVVPTGSLVLGDFDTDKSGSRFTAKVLSTPRSNLSIAAQSNFLPAGRNLSNKNLLQNSGIGAVAGAIVGGLGGSVLGGAAAGAALTYAIAPRETMIQPGQLVEVRLMQDFLAVR
jgi:hypothetical protein